MNTRCSSVFLTGVFSQCPKGQPAFFSFILSERIQGGFVPKPGSLQTINMFVEHMVPPPQLPIFQLWVFPKKQNARIAFFIERRLVKLWRVVWICLSYRNMKPALVEWTYSKQEDTATSVWHRLLRWADFLGSQFATKGTAFSVLQQGWCWWFCISDLRDKIPWGHQRLFDVFNDKDAPTSRGSVRVDRPLFYCAQSSQGSIWLQQPSRRQQMGLVWLRATH